ncbi:rCG27206 [Rattus norvegicus]|uniref:RCG27206 n=1 Tax=Rattus norvegicus TaxID=10116 RepID=A6HMK2_RAT|nr:rCG27206 [Rattus norvegicus]
MGATEAGIRNGRKRASRASSSSLAATLAFECMGSAAHQLLSLLEICSLQNGKNRSRGKMVTIQKTKDKKYSVRSCLASRVAGVLLIIPLQSTCGTLV